MKQETSASACVNENEYLLCCAAAQLHRIETFEHLSILTKIKCVIVSIQQPHVP